MVICHTVIDNLIERGRKLGVRTKWGTRPTKEVTNYMIIKANYNSSAARRPSMGLPT